MGQEQCAACHGANGEGNPAQNAPRIAGQPAYYLERQLNAFGNGARQSPLMAPIVKGLSEADRGRLSAHYSNLQSGTTGAPASAGSSSPQETKAPELATRGDEARGVQGCQNCHGPGGAGFGNVVPYLAGLDARYIEKTLGDFKDGKRNTDPSGQMPDIARALSDADVKALATYYASLPAPRPAAAQKPASTGPSSPGGSGGAGQEGSGDTPQGRGAVGAEPATSGGSQGAGGGEEPRSR